MGQYHTIFNTTKKEYFKIQGGAKLWEQVHSATAAALLLLLSNSNGRGGGDFYIRAKKHHPKTYKPIYTAVELMAVDAIKVVSGRWAGDSLVVQGDYAEEKDKGYIKNTNDYRDISNIVTKALLAACAGDAECEVYKILKGED